MKRLKNKWWGLVSSGLTLLSVMSCVSEPVNIDLPHNHPANPTARETAFITPPNPFQHRMEMKSDAGASMTEKKHTPSHQHQMTHEMDQMSEDSMSKPENGKDKQDHRH
ncbi:MAG: hypothetical protein JRF72_05380 [Deltaproteobacteria bacterium]|jgi:hypothetical protein|nr:hypothetical protein [Deltaproteobacteria bacterium]